MDHASSGRSLVLKYRMAILLMLVCNPLIQGCSQDDLTGKPTTQDDYVGPILVWNLSQFDLLAVYTHGEGGFNNNGTNQIDLAIEPDQTRVIQWSQGSYVSVVREKTQGGFMLGLTTQTPPTFNQAQSVLIVFDDGFRALVNASDANGTPGFPGFPDEITSFSPQPTTEPQGD